MICLEMEGNIPGKTTRKNDVTVKGTEQLQNDDYDTTSEIRRGVRDFYDTTDRKRTASFSFIEQAKRICVDKLAEQLGRRPLCNVTNIWLSDECQGL
ncbi:hypothetical protein RBB56_18135 [Kineothrix sp. MB12-C1]|nr:hypothetical protein [Kineothrix sp. MB12-C1]WMC92707.1 hypothetical protein RBB56_18135 [Kineothrix sp. MB12-C1]